MQLHGKSGADQHPFQGDLARKVDDFAPEYLLALHAHGIATEIVSYGSDFARFETDLARQWQESDGCKFPLVRVPATVETTWPDAGLQVRPCTFLAGGTLDNPIFFLREPGKSGVVRLGLSQMRSLHTAWSGWPTMLPSMLLAVLWHRPV